jgi:Protein of unknown function (DUF2442)
MAVSETALRRLKSVTPLPNYRLQIISDDAPPMTVDLAPDVMRGGVFRSLKDETKFAQVRISDNGYAIEWPEPSDDDGRPLVDIDADALLTLGLQQHVNRHAEGLVQRILRALFGQSSAAV